MSMFERYTEAARRVVFFARYEAVMRGAPEITPRYLLMGLLHEKDPSIAQALGLPANSDAIRRVIQLPDRKFEKYPGGDALIPLDQSAKIALAWTKSEADSDQSEKVNPIHLLRGMLCFPNEAADALNGVGIELESIRAAAKEGRLRMSLGRRIRYRLWRLLTDSIWPAIRGWALILGFLLLAILILHLFGL
jgi:ATP-dependent Clp protease ATP-binding subunit ClpC